MKKILLIEDDADLFALLKYNLEKEGFSASGQQTGGGALELCRRVKPDFRSEENSPHRGRRGSFRAPEVQPGERGLLRQRATDGRRRARTVPPREAGFPI